MTILPYAERHKSALINVYIDTFAKEPWNEHWEPTWVDERISWVAEVPNFSGYVATENNEAIGALLGYGQPFKGRIDYEILELFVHPNAQSKGTGRALVEALEHELNAEPNSNVYLITAKDSAAQKFYESLGYTQKDQLCFMAKSPA